MAETYDIFEKLSDDQLVFVEKAEGLPQAKMRFFFLTLSLGREYLVWDRTRGCEVFFRAAAVA